MVYETVGAQVREYSRVLGGTRRVRKGTIRYSKVLEGTLRVLRGYSTGTKGYVSVLHGYYMVIEGTKGYYRVLVPGPRALGLACSVKVLQGTTRPPGSCYFGY